MKNLSKFNKFVLAVAFQVAVILTIILLKVVILTGGTEITLRIEPVDPTSPLRGDYLAFRYTDLSAISPYTLGVINTKNGETVYVILKEDGGYWSAKSVQTKKPEGDNTIFLKGKVVSGAPESSGWPANYYSTNPTLQIVYGTENYFIPQGKGQNLNLRDKKAMAVVSVDTEGNAALKKILLDGQPWP